jgi:hypothetical protein
MFVDVQVTARVRRIVLTWLEPGSPADPDDGGGRIMTSFVELARGSARPDGRAAGPALLACPGGGCDLEVSC